MLQQQVHAHQLNAGAAFGGQNGVAHALCPVMNAEGPGNGGAGNVRVQNGHVVAVPPHCHRQLTGDHRLADAALAGHDAVDLAHPAAVPQGLFLKGIYFLTFAAAFAAGTAIMGTFAHCRFSFYPDDTIIYNTKRCRLQAYIASSVTFLCPAR